MSSKTDNNRNAKIFLMMVVSLMLISLVAAPAEAGIKDSVKTFWSKTGPYVKSPAFWVNSIIIFAALFMLYTALLSSKVGSDKTQQTMVYIVIGLVAIIIATKFVGAGVPQYLWHNDNFRKTTQFLIGPSQEMGACAEPAHSFWKALFGFNPNPPCCGSGAYFNAKGICRQAILRTNENGSGLPALIIASILFFLLLSAYGKELGFQSMGANGGKWFPIILSLLLGALLANERITKNNLVIIGGWIAVILIGNSLSKSLSGDKDPKGTKKGFGFGLAFAFVQLVASMLGTTLFGTKVNASDIGFAMIFWNLMLGLFIGYIYSILTGQGILGRVLEDRKKKAEADVKELLDKGKYLDAFLRSLPFIGEKYSPKKDAEKARKDIEKITQDIEYVKNLYTITNNPATTTELDNQIAKLETKLTDAIKKI